MPVAAQRLDVEIAVRRDLGDVYAGERVTHAVMGILYGAMLAFLAPTARWLDSPTSLTFDPAGVAPWLRVTLTLMAVGVVASGARDLYAALDLPGSAWPWRRETAPSR